jgi:hypothetical protein
MSMSRGVFLFPLAVFGLLACSSGSDGTNPTTPTEATFMKDIAPIFASCALCHHPGNATLVDLTNPFDPATGIINRPNSWAMAPHKVLVVPGHPETSFLIDKVERTDLVLDTEGSPMPWNIPTLDSVQIMTIRQWITDGAMNDDNFTTNVAPIFGDGMSLGRRGGSCAYCHYQGTVQPPDLTHPFDPMAGIVSVVGARGTRVVPGQPDDSILVKKIEGQMAGGPPMPYQEPRLSGDQIAKLKAWIAAGAQNN